MYSVNLSNLVPTLFCTISKSSLIYTISYKKYFVVSSIKYIVVIWIHYIYRYKSKRVSYLDILYFYVIKSGYI